VVATPAMLVMTPTRKNNEPPANALATNAISDTP